MSTFFNFSFFLLAPKVAINTFFYMVVIDFLPEDVRFYPRILGIDIDLNFPGDTVKKRE